MTATALPKMTARDMNAALYRHFADKWAVLTEVTARAQYRPPDLPADPDALPIGAFRTASRPTLVQSQRRIDVLLLRGANVDGGIERLAIEVKVTRADFMCDVRNPDKQAPWRALAHRHAYAVPEGLVAVGEVPADSGLLVVKRDRDYTTVTWARRAKKPTGHNPGPLPLANLMDAFYRAGRAEAHMKGFAGALREADPEQLRATVAKLRKELELLGNKLDRETEAKGRWQKAFAAAGLPACGTCGHALHLARVNRRSLAGDWEHRDPAVDAACEAVRRQAALAEREQMDYRFRMDEKYLYVPGPQPADLPEGAQP